MKRQLELWIQHSEKLTGQDKWIDMIEKVVETMEVSIGKVMQVNTQKEKKKKRSQFGSIGDIDFSFLSQKMFLRGDSIGQGRQTSKMGPKIPASW